MQNQGLQPGPVARALDSDPGLELPEDDAIDELDDVYRDVASLSPESSHRKCARRLQRERRVRKCVKEYPGPTYRNVIAGLVENKAPDMMPVGPLAWWQPGW